MRRSFRSTVALAAVFVTAACSGSDVSPTALGGSVADAVGDQNNNFTFTPGVVNVCAFFGNDLGPSGTFSASAPAGEDVYAGNFSITPVPHCLEVWNASSAATIPLTASYASASAGWELDRIVVAVGDGGTQPNFVNLYNVTSTSVNVNEGVGGFIWFKFVENDSPTGGGEGCTPGYWRQSHHFDSWTLPYTPSTPFSTVFANAFPGKTLRDVVRARGGGINALGRSAVAALLNAASGSVSYDLSVQDVIDDFNAAYASGYRHTMEQQKDVFDLLNNLGCPLN